MGVKSLWNLLTPVGRPVMLETMEGKAVAIDSSIWIYQFQATMRAKDGRTLVNAHVLGFLRRICKLLFYGMKPVFVFDGGAPALKRSTLNERRKKKSGAAASHMKLAEKLLAAQMRREALKHAKGSQSSKGKSKVPTGPVELNDDTVYLEDLDPNMPKTPARKQQTQEPKSSPKKKFYDHDPYRLPDVNLEEQVAKVTRTAAPDPRLATEEELRAFIEEMRPEDFDVTSPAFRELPTEVQYEIVGDLRLKSRQTSYTRLQQMLRAAPTPLDFSKQQIKQLQQRNALTQQLLITTDSIGKAHISIPVRIASERNKEYVLVKNEGAEGGWVLGIRDTGTREKPIVIDHDSNHGEDEDDEDDDMDMEEVDIPTTGVDPDLRDYRRKMALSAIATRYTPKKAASSSVPSNHQATQNIPLFDLEEDEQERDDHQPDEDEDEDVAFAIQQSYDHSALPSSSAGVDASSAEDRDLAFAIQASLEDKKSTQQSKSTSGLERKARLNALFALDEKPVASSSKSSHEQMPVPSSTVDSGSSFGKPFLLLSSRPKSQTTTPQKVPTAAVPLATPLTPSDVDAPVQNFGSDRESPVVSLLSQHLKDEILPVQSIAETFASDDDMEEVPTMNGIESVPESSGTSVFQPSRSMETSTVEQTTTPEPARPLSDSDDDMEEVPPVTEPLPEGHNNKSIDQRPDPTLVSDSDGDTISSLDRSTERSPGPLKSVGEVHPSDSDRVNPVFRSTEESTRISQKEATIIPSTLPNDEPSSRSPSPDEFSRREGSPRPLSPVEDWDAAQEIDPIAEEGEFARFMSQVKGRDIDDVRREIDDEIRTLDQQRKNAMRDSEDVTQQMITQIMMMLRLFGIPYITAPMEAEAQCAKLLSLGLVDGIITDDSDVFLFGGQRVFKNMFNQSKTVECFLLGDLSRELGLDQGTLIRLAYLLGSDYVDGLPGVGPVVAMELLKEFPGDDGLHKFKDWWQKVQTGKDKEDGKTSAFRKRFKKKFKDLYLPPEWPNPAVRDAYYHPTVDESEEPFKWGLPDLDALREFLREELGWQQSKVDDLLLPIIRKMGKRTQASSLNKQGNLDNFLDISGGSGTLAPRKRQAYSSKRLQQVVSDFRREKKRKNGSGSVTPTPEPEGGQEENEEEVPRKRARKSVATGKGKGKQKEAKSAGKGKGKAGKGKGRGKGKAKAKETDDEDEDEISDFSEEGDTFEHGASVEAETSLAVNLRPRPKPRPAYKGAVGTA